MGARVTYPSVEAMVEPTELAGQLGRPVDAVALAPMATVGSSSTESDFRAMAAMHATFWEDPRSVTSGRRSARWSDS